MTTQLNLLRGFELSCDGNAISLPLSAQRVLAFLALQDRPVLRLYVAGTLWLDVSEQRSYANLRSALWRVRRMDHTLVVATHHHLALADGVDVDVRRAIAASQRVLEHGAPASERDDLAGDLLPDWYEEWVEAERERLRQLRLHALEAIAEDLLAQRRYGQAVDACLLAMRSDGLRESLHRLLVRIYAAEGNAHQALRQYRWYEARLHRDVGLKPSSQLTDLVAELIGVLPETPQRNGDVAVTPR